MNTTHEINFTLMGLQKKKLTAEVSEFFRGGHRVINHEAQKNGHRVAKFE